MCTAAITITSKALTNIDNAEVLLKIKGFIAMFIQTMEVSIYPCANKSKKRRREGGKKKYHFNLTITDCI
jgi:hypothetical protein